MGKIVLSKKDSLKYYGEAMLYCYGDIGKIVDEFIGIDIYLSTFNKTVYIEND